LRGKGQGGDGDGDGTAAGEAAGTDGSKTAAAWHKVKKVITLGNAESGYNTGIQIAAAYTITKFLLPVRILLSVWATPWGARVLTRTWGLMRRARG